MDIKSLTIYRTLFNRSRRRLKLSIRQDPNLTMIGFLTLLCLKIIDEGEDVVLIEGDTIDEDLSKISETDKDTINNAKILKISNISVIPDNFMNSNNVIEHVVILDTVKTVGSKSFNSCSKLSMVDFGHDIVTISEYSFSKCNSLQKIIVGAELKKICKEAFTSTSITELNFHSNIEIQDSAFKSCLKLTKIQSFRMQISYGPYSFAECKSLETIDLYMASLSEYAFYECSQLKIKTIFGQSDIPDFCFAKTGLTDIQIDNAIKKIGNHSFSNCENLRSVVGGNVTEINVFAFIGCTLLTKALFPEIEIVENNAFQQCNSLVSFTFGSKLTSVAEYAFENTKIPKITFLSQMSHLGECAFVSCVELKEVKFDNSKVKTIPNSTFSDCQILEKVTFDDSVSNIEFLAFSNCTSLQQITFGSGFESIQENSFENCPNIYRIILAGNLQVLTEFINKSSKITDIEFGNTKLVPANLFFGAQFIQKVTLGNTVIEVQTSAFEGCANLETVVFGAKSEHISDRAFYGCSILKEINQANSIKVIGDFAFEKTAIPSLNFWPTLESIGVNSFASCSSLVRVDFGDSTPAVWEYSFKGCLYLKSVTFNKLTKVARGAFSETGITSIAFPCCEELGDHAFADCLDLTEAELGNLSIISKSVFEGCSKLTKVTSIATTSIEDKAFYHCKALSFLQLGSVTTIGNSAFVECNALKKFDFENIISVGEKSFLGSGLNGSIEVNFTAGSRAFEMCTGITSALINCEIISTKLFESCLHLEKVIINATKISDRAFADCNDLRQIIFDSDVKEMDTTAFVGGRDELDVTMKKASDGIVDDFLNITNSSISLFVMFNSVPEKHFFSVNSLKNVSLVSSKKIETSAFENCQNLHFLNLGTVETVGTTAFSQCSCLTTVKASPDNLLKEVNERAFSNCTSLKSFDFVPSIVTISKESFKACNLSGCIVIPINCTTVGSRAFSNSSISTVVFCGVAINGSKDAFDSLEKVTVSYSFNGTELFGLRVKLDNTPCGGQNPLKDRPGVIAGIVLGSLSVIAIIVIVIILLNRRKKKRLNTQPDAWDSMLVANEATSDYEDSSIAASAENILAGQAK